MLYERFLAEPHPSEPWVMSVAQKAVRSSPAWRPFAKPLEVASRRQATSILNGLFNWLVQAGYLTNRGPHINRFLPFER